MGLKARPILLFALLFLFFFQLLTEFVEAVYAFGLLGTSIPPEIAAVLLLLAPLILLLWQPADRWRLLLLAFVFLAARVAVVALDTRGKMIAGGVGVAAFLVLFPLLLWQRARRSEVGPSGSGQAQVAYQIGGGLALAVTGSILLRAVSAGVDISTQGSAPSIGRFLAVLAAYLLLQQVGVRPGEPVAPAPAKPSAPAWVIALCLGLTAALVILYFAFTAPNVIARWGGAPYLPVLTTVGAALLFFAALQVGRAVFISRTRLLLLNGLFVLALAGSLLAAQVAFPPTPEGYPLFPPDDALLHQSLLFPALLLFPVVLLDAILYLQALLALRPALPSLGAGFAAGGLFLLAMIFAQVFTTVYDYIPVVGPAFRDRFWLVFLVAGLVLAAPVLLLERRLPTRLEPAQSWWFVGAIVALAGVALAGATWQAQVPPTPTPGQTLTVLTYNIQQGYGVDGQKDLDRQLALIRQFDPDIVGLQESDSNRIAGGNMDIVRYFATQMGYHSYYGPPVAAGTFGIAFLSRYPIEAPRTFYMYSEGEQTATIAARVVVGATPIQLFVTHLGNGGPLVQQEAVLEVAAPEERVILMGDFNFRPGSEPYLLTTETFVDAWLRGTQAPDPPLDPDDRIDHIFISPELGVRSAEYVESPASDHPALLAEIALN